MLALPPSNTRITRVCASLDNNFVSLVRFFAFFVKDGIGPRSIYIQKTHDYFVSLRYEPIHSFHPRETFLHDKYFKNKNSQEF